MPQRMPSLNALRAFEAAARHLSFKEAARELFVTPGAVSQQIKRLEAELGVTLFHRMTRSIVLTEAGQAYYPVLRQAFQKIVEATDDLAPGRHTQVLSVSLFPSVAVKWLVPRLGRFSRCYPDIEVRISTSPHLVDFGRENVDVAIRSGVGRYPGLHTELLTRDELVVVCSPRLLEGAEPLRHPNDLTRFTLLHDDLRHDWPTWLEAAGATRVDADRGPSFSDGGLVLQAAVDGQGVAVSLRLIAADDIAAGRLVQPFAATLQTGRATYIVCPKATADVPKIAAFRSWLLTEVQSTMRNLTGESGE